MTEPAGKVIFGFEGMLTLEQYATIQEWWANPAVRAVYLGSEQIAPNRLYGAQINADGEAV